MTDFQKLIDNVADARRQLNSAHDCLTRARKQCQHKWVPSDPSEPHCSHPVCEHCKEELTKQWYCPDSNDHLCKYPPGSEWCSECHAPTERL